MRLADGLPGHLTVWENPPLAEFGSAPCPQHQAELYLNGVSEIAKRLAQSTQHASPTHADGSGGHV